MIPYSTTKTNCNIIEWYNSTHQGAPCTGKQYAKMCCACNTSPKLALRISVTTSHVTCLLVERCEKWPVCLRACGFWGCKNSACSISWPQIVKCMPNQGIVCFISYGSVFCLSFVFLVYVVLCFLVLVVNTSAIDCLERLVYKVIYCKTLFFRCILIS